MTTVKQFLIRWAFKQFKQELKKNPHMNYEELSSYGVADIIKVPGTDENAFVLS
jgi:hypothetical protein